MDTNIQKKEKINGIIAGISLLIMAVAAGFSYGYAHNKLIEDSFETTFLNLITHRTLFYAELFGWSIIFITDLAVAIALFFFFRSVSKQIAMITAVIRIIYTLILGVAIIQLFRIIPVLNLSDPLSDELFMSETASFLRLFEKLWSTGLIVFGLHLTGLGYLSVKSRSVPHLLGYLLYFAGLSYIFLHGSRHLNLFDVQVLLSIEKILALPMALAEILLAFWLIYFGFRKSTNKIYG